MRQTRRLLSMFTVDNVARSALDQCALFEVSFRKSHNVVVIWK